MRGGSANSGLHGSASAKRGGLGSNNGLNLIAQGVGKARCSKGTGTFQRDTIGGTVIQAAPQARRQRTVVAPPHPWRVVVIDRSLTETPDWKIQIVLSDSNDERYWSDWINVYGRRGTTLFGTATEFDSALDDDNTQLGFEEEWDGGNAWVYLEAHWESPDAATFTHLKPVVYTEEKEGNEQLSATDEDGDTVHYQSYGRILLAKIKADGDGNPVTYQVVKRHLTAEVTYGFACYTKFSEYTA